MKKRIQELNSDSLFFLEFIVVFVPMWMYTTANIGHAFAGRGVIPDYPITLSSKEFFNGEDIILKKVEELISN